MTNEKRPRRFGLSEKKIVISRTLPLVFILKKGKREAKKEKKFFFTAEVAESSEKKEKGSPESGV